MADSVTRRRFLGAVTLGIGGAIIAGWAIPSVAYLIGPSRRQTRGREWFPLGAADKVELGVPTLFKTTIVRTNAWESTEEEVAVYILTEDGRTFKGLSNICTHLGCRVRFVDDTGFFCPCHNAVFSKAGDVIDGPPPRALETYEIRVENGQIQVSLEV